MESKIIPLENTNNFVEENHRDTIQGDYLLPNLELPEQKNREIGVLGQRHKRYLLNHHKVRYYNLFISRKLTDYLADINEQAENPMLWVQKMNNIQNRVREIVNAEIIYI